MEGAIHAYRRENGKYGIRNHVVIVPVDDLSNRAAEGVSQMIRGTIALSHGYGRLQYGADQDLFSRVLIGTACNPNVAAAVVIATEPETAKEVATEIARADKPVAAFGTEGFGDLKTIELASRAAKEFVHAASELEREPVALSELVCSAKCGESNSYSGIASNPAIGIVTDRVVEMGGTMLLSDTTEITGAEHFLAGRAASPAVAKSLLNAHRAYLQGIKAHGGGQFRSQPSRTNIKDGQTTIEEKGIGNIQKTGSSPLTAVLAPGEVPKTRGLNFMDTPSSAAECVTLLGAAGSVLQLFTTGNGSNIGHPIVPVVKITANPKTVAITPEHIDVDISALLRNEMTLSQAGDRILEMVVRTANGRRTAAEVLGHSEFVISKLFPSA
jgi:(2R)-sulfolactate sulfo-lyase subunit beta